MSRRSGVSASVMQMKRSAQTPVSLVRSLSGLTLRLPVSAAQTSQPTWSERGEEYHRLEAIECAIGHCRFRFQNADYGNPKVTEES